MKEIEKKGYKWEKDEEEDVSSYRKTLKERESTVNLEEKAVDRTMWKTRFGRAMELS
jgi:hypothetical protein